MLYKQLVKQYGSEEAVEKSPEAQKQLNTLLNPRGQKVYGAYRNKVNTKAGGEQISETSDPFENLVKNKTIGEKERNARIYKQIVLVRSMILDKYNKIVKPLEEEGNKLLDSIIKSTGATNRYEDLQKQFKDAFKQQEVDLTPYTFLDKEKNKISTTSSDKKTSDKKANLGIDLGDLDI